jgi:hypothetical protein
MSVTYPTTITGPEVHAAVQFYLKLLNEDRSASVTRDGEEWVVTCGQTEHRDSVLSQAMRKFAECTDCGEQT